MGCGGVVVVCVLFVFVVMVVWSCGGVVVWLCGCVRRPKRLYIENVAVCTGTTRTC